MHALKLIMVIASLKLENDASCLLIKTPIVVYGLVERVVESDIPQAPSILAVGGRM